MKPAPKEAIFSMRGFSKSFGPKKVHEDLNFDLYPNEVLGLLGGSGSGKSVLLRALIGLEYADQGQVFFHGQDVTHFDEDQWNEIRKRVAYVFQGGALFDSLSVEENLLYPLDAHTKFTRQGKQKKVDDVLELLGLQGSNHLLPSDLSGGMQKRAGLARAMMLDPEVIFYDEPTAGLDPFNTRNIQEMINDLKSHGKGGVLVTHDMPTAMVCCDRIALLMNRQIAVSGTVEEMKSHKMVKAFVEGEVAYGAT